MDEPTVGDATTVERTFTKEDVRQFAALSGDDQPRHTEPDEDGRLMVQGLLTATLPTSAGGDGRVLARRMAFEFHRPVYTGERVTCEMTTESVEEREDRYELRSTVDCEKEGGETVLTAEVEGLVFERDL